LGRSTFQPPTDAVVDDQGRPRAGDDARTTAPARPDGLALVSRHHLGPVETRRSASSRSRMPGTRLTIKAGPYPSRTRTCRYSALPLTLSLADCGRRRYKRTKINGGERPTNMAAVVKSISGLTTKGQGARHSACRSQRPASKFYKGSRRHVKQASCCGAREREIPIGAVARPPCFFAPRASKTRIQSGCWRYPVARTPDEGGGMRSD